MSDGESLAFPGDPKRSGKGDTVVPSATLSRRYELLDKLGTGGMAEVYLARAIGIDDFEKIVVLKRIIASKRDDPQFVEMLRDEARVAATLEHPNIVSTHDIGIESDDYFFTMEYLHGEDVKTMLSAARKTGEPLPLELAMQIAISCAAGLHHAHEQTDYSGEPLDIVHRDVSPSNIIVTRQSGVKLIDFGIAKAASGKDKTGVGMVKGKAAYMSPEQCRGEPLDRRSDIFALGVVLYEMVTMQKPFAADNPVGTLHRILNTDPLPPRKIRDDCPPEIERLILRALQKNPESRYATAFEVQEELELATRDYGLLALPGALGRYLEHLFGPKPHPWARNAPRKPPPLPRRAWKDLDSTLTSQRAHSTSPTPRVIVNTNGDDEDDVPSLASAEIELVEPAKDTGLAVTQKATAMTEEELGPPAPYRPQRSVTAIGLAAFAGGLALAAPVVYWLVGNQDPPTPPAPVVVESAAAPTIAAEPLSAPQPAPAPPPAVVPETKTPAEPPRAKSKPAAAAPPDPAPTNPEPETKAPPSDPPEDAAAPSDTSAPEPAAPEPAAPEPDAPEQMTPQERRKEARREMARARELLIRDSEAAFEAARKATRLYGSPAAYALLGLTACRVGKEQAARRAYKKLDGKSRDGLVRACREKGISLE